MDETKETPPPKSSLSPENERVHILSLTDSILEIIDSREDFTKKQFAEDGEVGTFFEDNVRGMAPKGKKEYDPQNDISGLGETTDDLINPDKEWHGAIDNFSPVAGGWSREKLFEERDTS